MIEVFNRDKCRKMDHEAIKKYGIPSIVLMENAARGVFKDIYYRWNSFLILCGKGNNGGDGLALARHLVVEGKKVKVIIISNDENYSEDFKINFDILKKILDNDKISYIKNENDITEMFINDLKYYDVTIDGIFGVGLNKKLDFWIQDIIVNINRYGKNVVSLDVPSGLDCDLGIELDIAVKAKETYTFEVFKKGFLNYNAFKYIGKVKVIKIGIPQVVRKNNSDNICIFENEEYRSLIPIRELYGHKGDYGRALVVAGSKGFLGAAYISTECTIRAGAGLVTLACKNDIQDMLAEKLIEAMTISFESSRFLGIVEKSDSIAFGPGIGTNRYEEELLHKIINNSKCPIIIDADGITILAKNKDILEKLRNRAIITPHPGEMANLLGVTISEVESDRIRIASEFSKKYGVVVLLKGYNTIITDGNSTYINPTGNSKMASGGMGDALTGIINAFIAQKVNILDAALIGAYIHGYIADKLSKQFYILNARDIINEMPRVINEICLK